MAAQCNPRTLATVGAAAFALHVVLVALFWPIPPMVGSYSAPLYLLGNLSALAIAAAVWRAGAGAVAPWSRTIGTPGWRLAVLALVLAAVVGGLALRAVDRDLYFDFWREEGVFEPLTLLAYAASAALLWRTAGRAASTSKRPWRLSALFFLFLALEEVDWFGIFGGVIGRIEGAYAGSLHDVIRLAALGLVGPVAWAILAALALGLAYALWRIGWLDFGWIGRRVTAAEIGWVALAAVLLAVAAAEDAEMLVLVTGTPTAEEAIEMGGGLALAAWAVESAAGIVRRAAPSPGPGDAPPGAG